MSNVQDLQSVNRCSRSAAKTAGAANVDISRHAVIPVAHDLVVDRPLLFLDEEFIADRVGTVRKMGSLIKASANPVLRPDRPWEGRCCIIWGSVIWDTADGLFKMWYEAYDPLQPAPFHRLCYATSTDGINWEKPELGLIEYRGSRRNNIIHLGVDAIDSATIALDPFNPPPDQRFKMMLYDETERALLRFASSDGLRWRRLGQVDPLGYVGDRHSLMADESRQCWTIYHRRRDAQRTICMSTSDDFENWVEMGEVLSADAGDPPETELYGMIGFRDQGIGLGFLEMFYILDRRLDTQLVRLDAKGLPSRYMQGCPVLSRGNWGEWDSAWVCPGNSPPLRVGDELRVYYGGRSTLHWSDPPNGVGHIGAIGMAKLRPQGWAYLEADTAGGILTTKPLRIPDRSLCINADATGGEVRAELLDEQGAVIEGYRASDCHPLRVDATHFKLNWKGSSNLYTLRGRAVRVRLHMKNASLYAIWCRDRV